MNVVDSSGWLEYFADSKDAEFFARAIEDTESLVVPVITVYEVYKRLYQQRGKEIALKAIAYMIQGLVVDTDAGVAVEAAELSAEKGIPMADSIIYTLSKNYHAVLWTQDYDLKGLPNVKYHRKTKK
ncbi:MAG: type II toxin-antitoxin system VapC family toxin [Kiritimatiellia bacterium]